MKIPERLTSRKLWVAIVAAFVAFANAFWDMGLTNEQVWSVIGPLLGYILAEGTADVVERWKSS